MAPSTLPGLVRLPLELLGLISALLANCDIKNLRRTCRLLYFAARLRFRRVFLSANPRNIDVFRAIADHEEFRRQVVEIVWDDTCLTLVRCHNGIVGGEEYTADGCPQWFSRTCEINLHVLGLLRAERVNRPDQVAQDQLVTEQLPVRESWEYYQELLRQEEQVLASNADVEAFRYGLERLPSLQRVTVTPSAHGFLFTPLYVTPMIRAFPRGFNYPMPRSWHFRNMDLRPMSMGLSAYNNILNHRWSGFHCVTEELARSQQHSVVELVIDVNHRLYGINSKLLSGQTRGYNSLAAVLRRPSFRRLDLALVIGPVRRSRRNALSNGSLRRLFLDAPGLEHISLRTSEIIRHACTVAHHDECFISLSTIFPIDNWPHLQHFGLSQLLVRQDDLLLLLTALPATLRSVELSCLHFLRGTYRDLLVDMRDTLDWRRRGAGERPKLMVGIATKYGSEQNIWVDREVEDFLYRDGPNPFQAAGGDTVVKGMGVVRDALDPEHGWPN
jgi:hypothetical protein